MKQRLFTSLLMAAFLLGLVSCQREQLGKDLEKPFKITAQIQPISKVTYSVNNTENKITPTWAVNDKIIGFDNLGNTFTFTVSEVDPNGVATIDPGSYVPGEAETVYAIYYPGTEASAIDVANKKLGVDLSSQTGSVLNGNSPVLMCATAQVEEGGISLSFTNETAIVGLKRIKVGANDKINSVKVTGVVTSGEFNLVDDKLALVPSTEAGQIEVDLSAAPIVADGSGVIGSTETPALMFVALPKASSEISFQATTTASKEYFSLTGLTGDIQAGNYYYADKALSSPVAKIGTTPYFDIESAFTGANNAGEDVTITMLEDVTIAGTTDSLKLNNTKGKTVTLELNGCTISAENLKGSILNVSSDLIINDTPGNGGIINNANVTKARAMFFMDKGESVTINGGTFKNVRNTSAIYCVADNIVVNGGNFINASADGSCPFYMYNSAATVTVNGGNFINVNGGESAAFRSGSATVTINGGYFYNGSSTENVVSASGTDTKISGGFFSNKPVGNTVESGYEQIDISDSPEIKTIDGVDYSFSYEVIPSSDNYILQVGSASFESISSAMEAVNNATTDVTMTVLKDINLSAADSLVFTNASYTITLDLNGKQLFAKRSAVPFSALVISSAKTLEIIDNVGGGSINQATLNNSNAIHLTGGECNIRGGTITHSGGTNYQYRSAIMVKCDNASATLNVYGGTISAGGKVITFGSGSSDRKAYVNIYGGHILARTTDEKQFNNNDYAVLYTRATYGYLTITGGTVETYYQPASYINQTNTSITIGDPDDLTKAPFFFKHNPEKKDDDGNPSYIFKAYSDASAKRYKIYNCYTNSTNVDNALILTNSSVSAHTVTPVVNDTYGNSYNNQFCK